MNTQLLSYEHAVGQQRHHIIRHICVYRSPCFDYLDYSGIRYTLVVIHVYHVHYFILCD